jgi:hypothetical protein
VRFIQNVSVGRMGGEKPGQTVRFFLRFGPVSQILSKVSLVTPDFIKSFTATGTRTANKITTVKNSIVVNLDN